MDTYISIFSLEIPLHDVLRWFHIILAAYWLGGEWGVFNASTNVANSSLSLEERYRHMTTAVMIDILPRSAIVWLLPVGFHMADNYGLSPVQGIWVNVVWVATALWWYLLIWQAFKNRGTQKYVTLTNIDNKIRWFLIPALIFAGSYTIATGKIITTGEEVSQYWFSMKIILFGMTLIIGLYMRYVMTGWVIAFRQLAAEGPSDAIETHISNTLERAKKAAYVYWIFIGTIAFIGVTKPF
jgi:hypothetical protein